MSLALQDTLTFMVPRIEKLPKSGNPDELIKFSEFIKIIGNDDLRTSNVHWRLQHCHLFVDAIPFTHIGKLEALDTTVKLFCERCGYDINKIQLARHNPSDQIRTRIDRSVHDLICKLYSSDFEAFKYSPTDIVIKDDREERQGQAINMDVLERNLIMEQLYQERERLLKEIRVLKTRPAPESPL